MIIDSLSTQRGSWSVTTHGVLHLGPKQPSVAALKGTPNFPMVQSEFCWFFFFHCSSTHIFLIWIQAWCHLPPLSQRICGFSHTLITWRTDPYAAGNGSKCLIHFGDVDISSGSKQNSTSRCFSCCFPNLLVTFFFTPSFRGGRPYFSVPVVSWFLFCICAGCSLKTRISMELFSRWFAFSYLLFSLLALTAWICKSLFVLLTNISRNIWPVWFVTVLRESIFSYREVLPSFLAYTAERSITSSAMVHGCMCLLWKPPSSFNAF